MSFLLKTWKHKGSHQIFFLKRMILLITFWGGPPEDSPVILTPANIVTWFVIFLWKERKRNAVPKDNLPASIYMFSHVANPKGQEFVNKLDIPDLVPVMICSHFSCSAGSAWLPPPGLCPLLLAEAQSSQLVAEVSFSRLSTLRTQLVLDFLALYLPGPSWQLLWITGLLNFTLGLARP